jgi:phosphoglycerate dehydrogenase-like enzyme
MDIVIFHTEKKVINFKLEEANIEQVHEAFPQARVYTAEDGAGLIKEGIRANIVIGWGNTEYIDERYCVSCSGTLKWIHCLSAGVEGIMASRIPLIPGIRITNSSGIHGIPIAEHVLGYLLSHYRGLERIRNNQKNKLWDRFIADELFGKIVLIAGLGSIGRVIARRCKEFGTTVYGIKRTVENVPGVDRVYAASEFTAALPLADIVISVLPHTPQTENYFNLSRFARMKPGVLFINVGRGKTVDTGALIRGLKEGIISSAMLDTVEPEPLPPEHPLWEMNQVFISPHMSAESHCYFKRAFDCFKENATRFIKNEPMKTQIDLSANLWKETDAKK